MSIVHDKLLPDPSVYYSDLPFHTLTKESSNVTIANTKLSLNDFLSFRALSIQSSLEKELPSISQFLTQFEYNDLSSVLSPQELALKWLIYNDTRTPPDRADLYQRYVLAVLFFSTKQPWKNGDLHFLSPLHECHWHKNIHGIKNLGVQSCDDNMRIKSLFLPAMHIEGTIPEEIGYLGESTLTHIDLQNNRFYGSIPTTIGLLTRLQSLELNHNSLEGTIPTQLGKLHQIRNLLLQFNDIHGPNNTFPSEYFSSENSINIWADCIRPINPIVCESCKVCCDALSSCKPK